MALYRATGQSHKPAPPLTPSGKSSTIAKIQGGIVIVPSLKIPAKINNANLIHFPDTDRARKHGMEEYISADPVKFDHSLLFKLVQTLTLDFRLNDPFASLVSETRPTSFLHLIYLFFFRVGLVLTRTNLCPRRVLRSLRSTGMLPSLVLFGRFALQSRTWNDDWSHSDPLFFRLLRLARTRKSVWNHFCPILFLTCNYN